MTNDRACEILDPEHREHYDSIETVNEACRMAISALRAQSISEKPNNWISVKDRMPYERDSIFERLYETEKWNPAMFRKTSDRVIVCGEYPDRRRTVTTCKTHDGVWDVSSIFQMTITHWMPLPEPLEENN